MELLRIEHASFSYVPERPIYRDVSLTVGEGEVFCVLGPRAAEHRRYRAPVPRRQKGRQLMKRQEQDHFRRRLYTHRVLRLGWL